jgi:L-ascorbate metabolism protein UlaG (beta-lactamase superfamily)
MRLRKYSHSCVRIETDDGAVVVIDPGMFSEAEALDGVDAVLITHEHVDHLDGAKLADALGRRPAVRVFTHTAVAKKLDALAGAVTEVGFGEEFAAGGLPVRTFGGLHAEIHPEVPRVRNMGFYVANSLYHPGDSFDVPAGVEVETLFVPISGPWLRLTDSVDFVRAVRPRRAVALHDSLLSDAGLSIYGSNMERLAGCPYHRLTAGEPVPAS